MLTDYQYFTSLYAATLQDDGIEYHKGRKPGGGDRSEKNLKSVAGITVPLDVDSQTLDVDINTVALHVASEDMGRRPVESES